MSTDEPEPTPDEEDPSLDRYASAFRMTRRDPGHEDPERVIDPDEE